MERHKIEVNGGAITEFYHSCHTIRNVWHPRAVGIHIHSMGYTPPSILHVLVCLPPPFIQNSAILMPVFLLFYEYTQPPLISKIGKLFVDKVWLTWNAQRTHFCHFTLLCTEVSTTIIVFVKSYVNSQTDRRANGQTGSLTVTPNQKKKCP